MSKAIVAGVQKRSRSDSQRAIGKSGSGVSDGPLLMPLAATPRAGLLVVALPALWWRDPMTPSGSCAADQVEVRDYWRTKPRRKPKPPETYWTCREGSQTCGMHHRSQTSALRHSRRLDREARRQGRRADWQPEKVTRA